MTSSVHNPSSNSDNGGGPDEQQKQSRDSRAEIQYQHPAIGIVHPGIAPPSAESMASHPHLEVGHTMAQPAYPYPPDPYGPYGGLMAAYSAQAMLHPQMTGIPQAGMPLPMDTFEEPVYVNAKQYHGILRRRQSRAKAESENKLIKARKPYLHESRHLHALKRPRGCGGRFLNSKSEGNQQNNAALTYDKTHSVKDSNKNKSSVGRNQNTSPEQAT